MSAHTPIKVFDENVSHYSEDSKNTIFCHGIKILLILMHSKASSQVNKHKWIHIQTTSACQNIFPSRPIANTQTTSTWFFQDLLQQHVQNINLIILPPRTSFIFPPFTSYPSRNSGVSLNSLLTILPDEQDLPILARPCTLPSPPAPLPPQFSLHYLSPKPLTRLPRGAPDSKLTPTYSSSMPHSEGLLLICISYYFPLLIKSFQHLAPNLQSKVHFLLLSKQGLPDRLHITSDHHLYLPHHTCQAPVRPSGLPFSAPSSPGPLHVLFLLPGMPSPLA